MNSKNGAKKRVQGSCDTCVNFAYDEDYEQYVCLVDLDEDEYYRFIQGQFKSCPYFRMGDEYKIVQKQN